MRRTQPNNENVKLFRLIQLIKEPTRSDVKTNISDHLSDRTQRAKVNGLVSGTERVVRSVPQGSILGPLMFLFYVNDLPKSISESSIKLYADDIVIYKADTNHTSKGL